MSNSIITKIVKDILLNTSSHNMFEVPTLRGLRRMVQRLRCGVVRPRAGSILHEGNELAPPILAAYYVRDWLTIDICCDICVCQIFETKWVIIPDRPVASSTPDLDRVHRSWSSSTSSPKVFRPRPPHFRSCFYLLLWLFEVFPSGRVDERLTVGRRRTCLKMKQMHPEINLSFIFLP